ncbi:macro domain-containing protein [Endozoicomonas sp. ONNA1]|uniref:macro domain-containing protein n=1 Tax=Endozoicomonas sp. ONNA1 TaxID=2828740 RepID=UPI00214890F6|nr:macro domain-containing protein [Endozoicomonas sp. ONNA1]
MIREVHCTVFEVPAQCLINPVNTVGVMGAGLAKAFKTRYPTMFAVYQEHCRLGELQIGTIHQYKELGKPWIFNVPTKIHWRQPSRREYVERGLQQFARIYKNFPIQSVAFPPLGCGHGGLDWSTLVRPLMYHYLKDVELDVFICLPSHGSF